MYKKKLYFYSTTKKILVTFNNNKNKVCEHMKLSYPKTQQHLAGQLLYHFFFIYFTTLIPKKMYIQFSRYIYLT